MNTVLDLLLLISFVAGLVPALVFTGLYAVRSAWSSTAAGRAVMTLMFVITATYLSGVFTILFPEFFRDEPGIFLRIIVRGFCAVALIRMCAVLLKAQQLDHNPRQRVDK